ncbi:MAG: hypothetical protein D3910_10545 [Candidatus Electrothrix sp. ATG2]|nr:hypothetical protein [Candidatus Electrothrix sp. ATG2]
MKTHRWILVTLISLYLWHFDTSRDSFAYQSIPPLEVRSMPEHADKLAPALKMRLLDNTAPKNELLTLLVQIKGTPDNMLRDQLNELNAKIRTVAGTILTVTMPAYQLSKLAALDFVVYIELSRSLSMED